MKLILSLITILGAHLSLAAQVKPTCQLMAEQAVSIHTGSNDYDENGFEAFNCVQASNRRVVICDVSASKGNGAAMDTYRVVLNLTCTKVFRVELMGEE